MAYQKTSEEQVAIARSVALNNSLTLVAALVAKLPKTPTSTQLAEVAVKTAETFFKFLAPTGTAAAAPAQNRNQGSGASGGGKPKPAPKTKLKDLDPDSPQGKLYQALSEAFSGDVDTMESVMEIVSEWRGKSIPLKGIPNMTDARAGCTLRGLEKYLKENATGATQQEDDDIPF